MTIWHPAHTGVVHPWLCDQFGHMNVRHYANMFNEGMFLIWHQSGLGQSVIMPHGGHGVAGITRTNFLRECPLGTLVRIEGALVGSSRRTITFAQRMLNADTGEVHATQDSLEVFFNPDSRSAIAIPDALRPIIEEQLAGPDPVPELEEVPREAPGVARWHPLSSGVCFPWHCDQWGHMNVRWYAHLFDDAIFHIWSRVGTGWGRMEELGVHTVTGSTVTHFRKEVTAADLYRVDGGVARVGNRSVTFRQRMSHVETGDVLAFQDVVEVFFDPKTRRSAPIPGEVRSLLEAERAGGPG